MQEPNLFGLFASRLNNQKLNYMISGSVASIVYGEPRLTHDIDIILDLGVSEIANFIAAFPAREFYVTPIEVIRDEVLRPERGHFNLIHLETGFKADIFLRGESELHTWALERKKKIDFQGSALFIAPPEYVIIRKLEYYQEGHSDKHLGDIKNILTNSSEVIDLEFIRVYAAKNGLADLWRDLREKR
ncbi:MAG: hypothetical protein WBZ48_01340 [Bacteroidota bacterium]